MKEKTTFALKVWNDDGTPKIEREMPKEMWEKYRSDMDALKAEMRKTATEIFSTSRPAKNDIRYNLQMEISIISKGKLHMPLQNSEKFSKIPYRAVNSNSGKTIATSGNFPLVIKAVFEHFDISIKLYDLIRIAQYGDWISPEGGTYWHFVDTVCWAYGLETMRLSRLYDIEKAMKYDGIIVALLENKLFPEGLGRHLAVVRGFVKGKVIMQSPSKVGYESITLEEFFENCDVIWAIYG